MKKTIAIGGALVALAAIGTATAFTAGDNDLTGAAFTKSNASDGNAPVHFDPTKQTATWTVPDGVNALRFTAQGGNGGRWSNNSSVPAGAVVRGSILVDPGQQVYVSVGGDGGNGSGKSAATGGWAAYDYHGGNGKAEKDTLRSSSAGGGATVIEVADADGNNKKIVLVAAGGGGEGAHSGDIGDNLSGGGNAGCDWLGDGGQWNGADGNEGSLLKGGKGGKAAAGPPTWGENSHGGTGLGGNGGAGGGGVLGGNSGHGASGTSAGGGGGAGSSAAYDMVKPTVGCVNDTTSRVTITPLGGL